MTDNHADVPFSHTHFGNSVRAPSSPPHLGARPSADAVVVFEGEEKNASRLMRKMTDYDNL